MLCNISVAPDIDNGCCGWSIDEPDQCTQSPYCSENQKVCVSQCAGKFVEDKCHYSDWCNAKRENCEESCKGVWFKDSSDEFLFCLKKNKDLKIVTRRDKVYSIAKNCYNKRSDLDERSHPDAIVKPKDVKGVQHAVKCAKKFTKRISARTGGHDYEADSCMGDLILDVSRLESYQLLSNSEEVEFGAGHIWGQLYEKLERDGLIVSGGGESQVGTSGLLLGCGRGTYGTFHGLACKDVTKIEYVNANGEINVVSNVNDDMLWMARGGGGEFPGIVVKWTMKTHPIFDHIEKCECKFKIKHLKKKLRDLPKIYDKKNAKFPKSHIDITLWNENSRVLTLCFHYNETHSCDDFGDFMEKQMGTCSSWKCNKMTLIEYLLHKTWDRWETREDLTKQQEWPLVTGMDPNKPGAIEQSLKNSVIATRSNIDETNILDVYHDEYMNTLKCNDDFNKWDKMLLIYPITRKSPESTITDPVAYKHTGDETYAVHWLQTSLKSEAIDVAKSHDRLMFDALHAVIGCSEFYNYLGAYGCKGKEMLEGLFSDVARIKSIKEEQDPTNLFYSPILDRAKVNNANTMTMKQKRKRTMKQNNIDSDVQFF